MRPNFTLFDPVKIGEKWLRNMINKSSYTYNQTSSIYLTGGLFAAAKSQATVKIENNKNSSAKLKAF